MEAKGGNVSTGHPASRVFRSGDLQLHYLEWGSSEATPIILLHHLNTHAHAWDQFAAAISNSYRVLALDMRGHGDSEWSKTGSYTTADHASDVAALMDHLKLERAVILGGSVGGRVALVYAAENPQRAAALIMEDVGPVRSPENAANFTRMAEAEVTEFDNMDAVVEYMRAHPGGHSEHRPEAAWRYVAKYATRLQDNGKLSWKRDVAMHKTAEALQLWGHVERIQCPFLLILGSDSTTVSPEHRDRMMHSASNSTLVTVQEAGHIVVHDRPQEYQQAVLEFLKTYSL
ncbi:MAG: alpha/beta hydrolase [Chloroflexi bacterium]|nr:alpha/beta hydrolase [Chloroflexota bacterium]MCZ6789035.1 alpha/beta hydrolase [Chloroflexota bacterium]